MHTSDRLEARPHLVEVLYRDGQFKVIYSFAFYFLRHWTGVVYYLCVFGKVTPIIDIFLYWHHHPSAVSDRHHHCTGVPRAYLWFFFYLCATASDFSNYPEFFSRRVARLTRALRGPSVRESSHGTCTRYPIQIVADCPVCSTPSSLAVSSSTSMTACTPSKMIPPAS